MALEGDRRPTTRAASRVADRPFQVDFTLSALKVPAVAHALKVGFTLSRAASVTLQIETKAARSSRSCRPRASSAGAQSLAWDDTTTSGAKAPTGAYVARVDRDERGRDVGARRRRSRCAV